MALNVSECITLPEVDTASSAKEQSMGQGSVSILLQGCMILAWDGVNLLYSSSCHAVF